jgi:hypothetical protein
MTRASSGGALLYEDPIEQDRVFRRIGQFARIDIDVDASRAGLAVGISATLAEHCKEQHRAKAFRASKNACSPRPREAMWQRSRIARLP